MSRLHNFEYMEIDGKKIWVYGKPGHPEARIETPGKHGEGDWPGSLISPPTCEVKPTFPAFLLVGGAMLVSQRMWPEDDVFDLDFAGYLEKVTTAKNIEDVVLLAHSCHLQWELFRKRNGRKR